MVADLSRSLTLTTPSPDHLNRNSIALPPMKLAPGTIDAFSASVLNQSQESLPGNAFPGSRQKACAFISSLDPLPRGTNLVQPGFSEWNPNSIESKVVSLMVLSYGISKQQVSCRAIIQALNKQS